MNDDDERVSSQHNTQFMRYSSIARRLDFVFIPCSLSVFLLLFYVLFGKKNNNKQTL